MDMSLSNEQIIEAISSKSVLEVIELVRLMEDKFGVSAAAVAAPAAQVTGSGEGQPEEVEQTEFSVKLTAIGDKKIDLIKEVKAITGQGLKEAKALVDGCVGEDKSSVVKEGIDRGQAEEIQKRLQEIGATVEIV